MKAYIVRHADKAKGDYYDAHLRHHDQPISRRGRKQALMVMKYFRKKSISSIYVSEYVRTGQTIRPLTVKKKIVPVVDSRLNEIDIGIIDGLPDEEIREKYPEAWSAYQDRDRDFQWPGGETGAQAQGRIVDFLMEQTDASGDILVVAHDGIIRTLICYILAIPVYRRFEFRIDTASITEIEWDAEKRKWKLIRLNQILEIK
jgi:broad specificity phosphatase PhoE